MEGTTKAAPRVPTARDWMEVRPTTVAPGGDLLQAIELLAARKLPAAAVVAHDGRVMGMLTEKDCLRILAVSSFHVPRGGRVADFMSRVSRPVSPDDDVFVVAERFLDTNFPALPVVEDGRLVGVVSRQRMLDGVLELVRRFAEARKPSEDVARQVTERPESIERMQRFFGSLSREQLVRIVGRKR